LKNQAKRRYMVMNDPVQVKFLTLLLVSMLLPAFLVGTILYMFIFKILADQQAADGVGYFLYPVIMKVNLGIAFGFVPLFLLLFALGAILSHRFSGPLQRLQREIEHISKTGDFKKRLNVRKYDYIQPLIGAVNGLMDRFCETHKENRP